MSDRLDQHCKSLIASLSAFGGVAIFVKEKFQDETRIFVKVEICCFLSNMQSHIGLMWDLLPFSIL